jgi:hypothetical protein
MQYLTHTQIDFFIIIGTIAASMILILGFILAVFKKQGLQTFLNWFCGFWTGADGKASEHRALKFIYGLLLIFITISEVWYHKTFDQTLLYIIAAALGITSYSQATQLKTTLQNKDNTLTTPKV